MISDRARRALSETMFGQTWSNPQTNRPWVYRNLQIFWGFLSCFLRISPLRGGIFEKPNRPLDRARRVASWSSFGQTWSNCQTNPPWKYSNPPVRYPTCFSSVMCGVNGDDGDNEICS